MREYLEPEIKVETLKMIINECSIEGIAALKEQLVNYAWEKWGTSSRTALEYLRRLVMSGLVYDDDGDMWSVGRWSKIKKARNLDYLIMEDIINKH